MCTRPYATPAAITTTGNARAGDSSTTPVANAAADAEWPLGNDVVRGWRASWRRGGTSVSNGRVRRTAHFAGPLATALATPSDISPRTAARRPSFPVSASAPATPNHSRPWLAPLVSRGTTSSMTGLSYRATPEKTLLSTRSEEHTSELQSQSNLVCRLLLEKKKKEHNRLRAESGQLNVHAVHRRQVADRCQPVPSVVVLPTRDDDRLHD